MYTIGKPSPLNPQQIDTICESVGYILPSDYSEFLQTYGYGNVDESIYFIDPDKDYLKNNFSGYIDLWEWKEEQEQKKALTGLTIATSIDGDIILCVDNHLPYLLLPRHSSVPLYFDKWEDIFVHLFGHKPVYFDTDYSHRIQSISLIKNGNLDKTLIDAVLNKFLSHYKADAIFGEQQPKYVLQNIGGWVYFNLVYKNSIRIKYQTIYQDKADEIINFVKESIVNF